MSSNTIDVLAGLSVDVFLDEYWQKKPLLIRNALPGVETLLEPEELAGLALEEAVESRLILERSPVDWELRHGPFDEKTFKNLPKTHWSLLIQALEHNIPAVADLLDHFNFIPSWRIDDIMASYAPTGGSVGPHYDYYDVFLIQAHGQRRWQIGDQCDDDTPIVPNLPLKILLQFEARQEHILYPGDMLYLPPGQAHHGVAVNDCMTFSVGFRAATEQELLSEFSHFLTQQGSTERRFQDGNLKPQSNPGWLSDNAIDRFSQILTQLVSNRENVETWLGEFLSQTKYLHSPEPPEGEYTEFEVQDLLAQQLSMRREESSRFIFTGEARHPTQFFVNGHQIPVAPLTPPLICYLCKVRHYDPSNLSLLCESPANLRLLVQLLNMGVLYFEDEVYDA